MSDLMTYLGPALIFALLFAPAMRLLLSAYRTRSTPEIWAGIFFLGTSIGLPLRVLGHSLMVREASLADDLNTVGHMFFAAATCAMAVFTWRVFRAGETWARILALFTICVIPATTAVVLMTGNASAEQSIAIAIANAARLIPLLWAFVEASRYWRAMTRRTQIGLADPIVTNRFLLWSIWTAALAILPVATLLLRVFKMLALEFAHGVDVPSADSQIVVVLIRVVFLVTAPVGALALCLSFFPPARYLAFIRRNAATPDARTSRPI